MANTDTTVDVYAEANGTVIGKMYKNTVVTVEEEGADWYKITSGDVVGYVTTESLLFGSAAVERAKTACAAGTKDAQTMDAIKAQQKEADVRLLAALIYCEAGNQPYDGKVAVGAVVMNRIVSKRFPNTLEGVIYQRGQFTPAMNGKVNKVLESGKINDSCIKAAKEALSGVSNVGDLTHFRRNNGRDGIVIGNHVFY